MLRFLLSYLAVALIGAGALTRPVPVHAQVVGNINLGMEIETLSPERAAVFNLLVTEGVLVLQANPGSPAANAGIQRGDVITHLGRQTIKTREELIVALAGLNPNEPFAFIRQRANEAPLRVDIALAAPSRPAAAPPVLVLNTKGHMSLVRGMAAVADGRHIVSAGDDKVIRVWDWQTGQTVRTIHGYVGLGEVGKIFGLSLSPAGTMGAEPKQHRWLAVSGRMNDKPNDELIRIYDFNSGRLEKTLRGGHNNNVNAVAFAPDGRRLVSGAWDNTAVVWDVETGTIEQTLKGHTETIFNVIFTRDGQRVVTASYDHTLKMWDARTGRLIETMKGHEDGVNALAVHPTTGQIYSGDYRGVIRRWDGTTGKPLGVFANQETLVGHIAFSRDGRTMVTGIAKLRINPINYGTRVWEVPSGKLLRSYDGFNNNVQAGAVLPEGNWIANAGGSAFPIRVWDFTNGRTYTGADGNPLEMKGTGDARWGVAFSADGRHIAWGNTWRAHTTLAQNPLEWQLRLPTANQRMGQPERLPSNVADNNARWMRLSMSQGGNSLVHRKGGSFGYDAILDVVREGKTIASIERPTWDGFQHLVYGFSPDGKQIISGGGSGQVISYGLDGNKIGHFTGHESDIWSIAPSPDGRYLLTGSGDQTVRLWNLANRKLIVSIFHGTDGEWVMWTPEGYFTGSADAGELVGWQQNQGTDREARYIQAYQLRHFLRRPDIVERSIALADSEAAVRELAGKGPILADLVSRPPPELHVGGDKSTASGKATIVLEVEKTGRDVLAYDVHLGNYDKSGSFFIPERRLATRQAAVGTDYRPTFPGRELVALEVDLRPGTNLIGVVARTDAGETPIAVTQILSRGDALGDKTGVLRILSIGIDNYPTANPYPGNLTYAAKDARDFAETARKAMGPRHTVVLEPEILVSGAGGAREPTKANIEAALKRLSQAGPKDTVVLFMAGHGESRGGQYVLLPTDFVRRSADDPGQNVVEWRTIREALANASGQRLVFLDTCHAGNAYNDALVGDAKSFAFAAFTAASAGSVAKEDPNLGQGRFTHALRSGLEGKAARDGAIEVYDLGPYVARTVKVLSNGEQEAEFFPGAGNFVIVKN